MKKKSPILKLLACAVIILALCLGNLLAAFAALEINGDGAVIGGTPANPAQAAITKILDLPEGTNVPAADFKFDVTPISWDGGATGSMPTIGTAGVVTIGISSSDASTTDDGIVSVAKESASLFTAGSAGGLFGSQTWPGTGEFIYKVTEQQSTYTVNPTPPPTEVMTYTLMEYELRVYVKQHTDGSYYIWAIGAARTHDDDGAALDDEEKVDPTPGGDGDEYDYSQMIFTNTYVKILDNDPDTGKTDVKNLSVSKAVSGDFANENEYFNFKLTVTLPDIKTDDPLPSVYKAYVLDASDADVTSADNGTLTGTPPYIAVIPGTELSFNLKHDQRLVILGLPVGSTYDVEETSPANYKASVVITSGGVAEASYPSAPATGETVKVTDKIVADVLSSTGANLAAYSNLREAVTPAGIAVDNLPYLVLIGVMLAAFAVFGAVKLRKRAQQH